MQTWILLAMLLWPLIAAPVVRFVGRDPARDTDAGAATGVDARMLTLIALVIEAALGIAAWVLFKPDSAGWQVSADVPWIPDIGARLTVGIDGLSLPMLVMTTLLMPLALLGSWNNVRIKTPAFGALLLALTSGLVGVFVSLDLLLFYMSWELMLIPTYFIIGIWGGVDRTKAVLKYVIMTMVGSLLMLVAIAALWTKGGGTSFSIDHFATLQLSAGEQLFMFSAFFLAFAVKSGLVPFHSWLPDAQQTAPTIAAVTLGIKVGTYAILRFAIPLFPAAVTDARVQNTIIVLSVVSILYGAFVAMAQTDFKRLISYSSISHLGFIMLGSFVLSPQSLQGATWITVNHGITTSALFLLAGMLQDRRGTNVMAEYGGLARVVPLFSLMLTLAIFSTIGLPGTNGFVGEFLVLLGTYGKWPVVATISTSVVIIAAIYGLRALQAILFGKLNDGNNGSLRDLSVREFAVMSAFAVGMVWLGLAPRGVLQRIESGTTRVQQHYPAAAAARQARAANASTSVASSNNSTR
ncbi:MAG: NADH-quinone oxidoreductase subunit M [Gemmatimonadota bacterium]|nr:NADH-quinone oxidoreductase subunit M [Gemmatimonadota bacterium]